MDIAALSVISTQTSTQNAASIMVLKKSMAMAEQNGQGLVNLIQSSGPSISLPYLGKNVDISI
ncbi:hypothetical protein SDC9_09157 [bioreactor metagenome]|uniref:Motility protein n=1 Tax=bioreactor metagenome TaxID=1076179 RepID=A0A644T9J8_9ZZZZ|nr:YjfB family protein [Negativicutes bacterium]